MYENAWTHNGSTVDDEYVEGYCAFVYIVTNTTNDKKYIGKKRLQFLKTKTVKKKKKRTKVPSDWKDYYGSNKQLQEDIQKLGKHKFKREILYLCKTLGESSYYEAREQFLRNVLKSDDYYNDWIIVRVTRKHLPKED